MESRHMLGTTDYLVVCVCLLISLAIGIKFRNVSKNTSASDYMMAGKNMTKLPVVMSICVTMVSALSLLGGTMEIYRFGIQLIFMPLFIALGIFLASIVFIPVYFECGVSSSYEFLELRYGPLLRRVVSGLFIIQMVLFMSVVLYVPALSLSAVTDLSLELSIIVIGLCCSVCCSIGGLKGVMWTDVFQAVLIFLCLIIVLINGTVEAGGPSEIYRRAEEGGRLVLFNFKFDLTTRHNWWNMMIRCVITGLNYGVSQLEVQRMLALSSYEKSRSAISWSILPNMLVVWLTFFIGLALYAVFHDCDPVLNAAQTGITKYDQVFPYYIVSRLSAIPGVAGLCIAGIFSASLSTLSSGLNSLATVTVLDYIKPMFNFTERKTVYIAKALTLFYGVICIAFSFVIAKADSIQAVGAALMGVLEGPVTAIFVFGVLTRKGTEKCMLVSLCLGAIFSSIIGFGYIFGGRRDPSLPASTSGCDDSQLNIYENVTSLCTSDCTTTVNRLQYFQSETFVLFRISFMWISFIGLCFTSVVTLIGITIKGWKYNAIPADSKCLSPVTRLWMRKLPEKCKEGSQEDLELQEKVSLYTPDV